MGLHIAQIVMCDKALNGGVAQCLKRSRRDLLHCDEQSLKISTPGPGVCWSDVLVIEYMVLKVVNGS